MAAALHQPDIKDLGKQRQARGFSLPRLRRPIVWRRWRKIGRKAKEDFQHAGGGEYHYIPCLNERNDWMHALTDLVMDNLQGCRSRPMRRARTGAPARLGDGREELGMATRRR